VIEETEDGVCIRIIDNGEGIGEEHCAKIFEMFYRASERSTGSGIGLYIVKEVVQKLRGNVSVNSEKYKGSEFVVQLPNLRGVH
jgi:signal transduction histidine kinase